MRQGRCSRLGTAATEIWIPAFAGMTATFGDAHVALSYMEGVNDRGPWIPG